ncbi:MAG: hypothetical protein ACJ763_04585 [Bdellovibrionia bacterium]
MRASVSFIAQIAMFLAIFASYSAPLPSQALAAENYHTSTTPSLHELGHGIADRLTRVQEFRFIQAEAAKLGVRAWLFGGTAAGYAHYVKWDMQREKGDHRFQPDRFDYDYTNIYRSTQDLDVVIDGNAQQAEALQNLLAQKYPHLQGSKTAWEVRLLTEDMGDKQAIVNNPDFMNQHTDSNSTGMIELTKPYAGESVVRDVRDWKSKEPYFLKDVHDGMLHYYFSPLHETTKFAKDGRNPPILSAIRFLTKAFQYELKIRPEDTARINAIIDSFDPKKDTQNPYVKNWIEKNGKKLIQNAVNIEYAWDTLEKLGLRKKLEAIQGNPATVESLAWWMNKEPLRTHPLGVGSGKTAKELGLDLVAHETNNFLAYESITRAHTGDSNVLISRNDASGELATFGDGFYTRIGRAGARGTGLTVRFHLEPGAREGTDFTVASDDYIIIKNKAALRVIPESLNIGPVEFFQMLANDKQLTKDDRGILEKLKRRIESKLHAVNESQERELVKIVRADMETAEEKATPLLTEWFSHPISKRHPELVDELIKKGTMDDWIMQNVLTQPHWNNHPEWVSHYIQAKQHRMIAKFVLSQPVWKDHPELVRELLKERGDMYWTVQMVLSQPHWTEHPELIETLLKDKNTPRDALIRVAIDVLSKPYWKNHPEWVESLLERGDFDHFLAQHVFSQPHWADHPEWVERLLKKDTAKAELIEHVFSQPQWKNHPEWIDSVVKKGVTDFNTANFQYWRIARFVLSQPQWKDHPEWIETLVKAGTADDDLAPILHLPHWKDHPELRRLTNGAPPSLQNLRAAFRAGESVQNTFHPSCVVQELKGLL